MKPGRGAGFGFWHIRYRVQGTYPGCTNIVSLSYDFGNSSRPLDYTNLSMNEWAQLSRVNRVATTLFGNNQRVSDEWARMAWMKWQYEGIEPEDLACRRTPGLAKRLGRAVKPRFTRITRTAFL